MPTVGGIQRPETIEIFMAVVDVEPLELPVLELNLESGFECFVGQIVPEPPCTLLAIEPNNPGSQDIVIYTTFSDL